MHNAKILQQVNERLKRGWVGYRYLKGSNGEKLPSKFLYFAFYQGSQQKFVNSKTNDPEEAYRQLLDARGATGEGMRLLPSEVSHIRYEDLRAILLDYYREHKPRSIIKRYTGDTDSAGIPLAGPLEEIGTALRELRKSFPKQTDHVLNFRNFRNIWNATCSKLGLGKFNPKTREYTGLTPHDFRRSAARNLIKAGVDRRVAMKITGHKTEHIFERYNIKTTDDVREALIKAGKYQPAIIASIR